MTVYNGIFYKLEYDNYDIICVTDGAMAVGIVIFTIIKYIFWSQISPYLMAIHCLITFFAHYVFTKHSSLTIKILLLIFDHFVLLDLWSGFMYNYNGQVDNLVLLSLSIINVYIHKHTDNIHNESEYISLFLFKLTLVMLFTFVHPCVFLIIVLAGFVILTNTNKFNSLIGISVSSYILTNYYLKNNYDIVFNNLISFNLLHLLCTILTEVNSECLLFEDKSQYGFFIAIMPLPILDVIAFADIVRLLLFLTYIKRDYIFNPPEKILFLGIFDIVLPSDLQFIENESRNCIVDVALLSNQILSDYYNYTSTLSDDERHYIASNQKYINNVFVLRDFYELSRMPDYLKIIPMLNINDYHRNGNIHSIMDNNDSLITLNNLRGMIHKNYYKDITNEFLKVRKVYHEAEKTTFRNR
jgi:hypothetical protein